jgi:hypothetical protein
MTIHSFGMVCPIIVGLIILFWDRTPDVGDLPSSLSCPGPFGRAIVWQPCFEPLKLDTSRAAPEEMGVDGQMHDFIICSRMRVSRGFLQVRVQYVSSRFGILGDLGTIFQNPEVSRHLVTM